MYTVLAYDSLEHQEVPMFANRDEGTVYTWAKKQHAEVTAARVISARYTSSRAVAWEPTWTWTPILRYVPLA